ncbi:hypothetical protein HYH03_003747 [Edaphochlamys debaryana]|uniref:Uncharacterized protein n=1 Tax=Edaphochlamys debaryana TaxID=47281 RepID=A0A835Y9I3_9CHLO|nr:hypothetical protein HYH03_003747 [Edaphochlamys debaryana]|eukprot:KAG2498496.1 hypothetical protein HYH03_003747 [Edaphochlamys debaryana]
MRIEEQLAEPGTSTAFVTIGGAAPGKLDAVVGPCPPAAHGTRSSPAVATAPPSSGGPRSRVAGPSPVLRRHIDRYALRPGSVHNSKDLSRPLEHGDGGSTSASPAAPSAGPPRQRTLSAGSGAGTSPAHTSSPSTRPPLHSTPGGAAAVVTTTPAATLRAAGRHSTTSSPALLQRNTPAAGAVTASVSVSPSHASPSQPASQVRRHSPAPQPRSVKALRAAVATPPTSTGGGAVVPAAIRAGPGDPALGRRLEAFELAEGIVMELLARAADLAESGRQEAAGAGISGGRAASGRGGSRGGQQGRSGEGGEAGELELEAAGADDGKGAPRCGCVLM